MQINVQQITAYFNIALVVLFLVFIGGTLLAALRGFRRGVWKSTHNMVFMLTLIIIAFVTLDPLCKFLECSIDDLLERNLESSAYRKVSIDWDSLPKNLAEARKSSSLSKEAFAEALGISSRVIRNYESGSATPSFQLLESWADLSKKQAADFLKKPVVF